MSWWILLCCTYVDALVVCSGESKKERLIPRGRDLKKLKVQCPIPSGVSNAICTTRGFDCGVQSVTPKTEIQDKFSSRKAMFQPIQVLLVPSPPPFFFSWMYQIVKGILSPDNCTVYGTDSSLYAEIVAYI